MAIEDVIQVLPIQTMTETTWNSVKDNCLWYGVRRLNNTYI